jgi:hypothetical protein
MPFKHPSIRREWQREWGRKHKIKLRRQKQQRKIKKAGGRAKPTVCDVCRRESKLIVFDHCHKTKQFRGWLCFSCNIILGHVQDDPNILWRLGVYLKQNEIYGRQV